MVCQTCGVPVAEGGHFCSKCGAQVVAAQPMYAAYPPPIMPPMSMRMNRVQRHLQTVGILWCVFAGYRILSGVVGMSALRMFTMRGFNGGDWPLNQHFFGTSGPAWVGALLPVIAVYTVVMAALAVLVGYSLLTHRPWGRTLAIVVGILTLLKPVFGTALGIYTLWVLAPGASGFEYDAMADRS
jgi:hypothetical protein